MSPEPLGFPMTRAIDHGRDAALRRVAPRYKVFQPAAIDWAGTRLRAHVLDVSARGARLHCAEPPPVGAQLALSCSDLIMRGHIVWARQGRFGIEFHSPIPEAHVRRIVEGVPAAG